MNYQCPSCGGDLPKKATSCRCGWVKTQNEETPSTSPGHEVYINPATGQPYSQHMQRIIEKNMDDRRYGKGSPSTEEQIKVTCAALGRKVPVPRGDAHLKDCKTWCEERGLYTAEQCREWLLKHGGRIGKEAVKAAEQFEREPGSDG